MVACNSSSLRQTTAKVKKRAMEGSEKEKSRIWKYLPSCLKKKLSKSSPTATENSTQNTQIPDADTSQSATVSGGETVLKKDVSEKFVALSAKEIWQTAFDQLRASESTKDLVVEYEEFLRPHLSGMALGKDGESDKLDF